MQGRTQDSCNVERKAERKAEHKAERKAERKAECKAKTRLNSNSPCFVIKGNEEVSPAAAKTNLMEMKYTYLMN